MSVFLRLQKISASFLVLALLGGCATNYEGPKPNFELKGESAKYETENFTLDANYFAHTTHVYQMGPEGSSYFASSLKPIIKDVSQKAFEQLQTAQKWEYANYAFLVAALGLVIAKSGSSWASVEAPYLALLGLAIGSGIYANITVGHALDEYNKTLPSKFTPKAQVSLSY